MATQSIKAKDITPGTVLVSENLNNPIVTIENVINAGEYVLLFADTGDCWEIPIELLATELTDEVTE